MTDNFVKGYALIKSQCISKNILDVYLPFIAAIIIDEDMEVVDVNIICEKLQEKYDITFQSTFIRQVLSNAMENRLVNKVHENYIANKPALKKYYLSDDDFVGNWNALIKDFSKYAKKRGYETSENEMVNNITNFFDDYDDHVIFNHIGDIDTNDSRFLYLWCNYILSLRERNIVRYTFIENMCMANIVKATLFYTNQCATEKVELQVFLDTPMIFALLGMDTPERKKAYKYIVDKAKSLGMTLHVFDHNLEEVLGIMERAANWAQHVNYDPVKANKVAQFFREAEMSPEDIVEYIGGVEDELNRMGITRYNACYTSNENLYQADEEKIFQAIKNEYGERATKYCSNGMYDNSIRTDVRSIVMTHRRRQGALSTVLQSSKAIFITTNGAIAKVSKDIMEEDELTKSKIPASVTADIFGTLLWLDYGDESNKYSNFKLLADCKALLRPTPLMKAKFAMALEGAYQKKAEGLTEEKFLFLRSHPIVQTKLLDVTTGDYSQFTDQTWRDVYAKIEAHAQFESDKKYEYERELHEQTKTELNQAITARDSAIAERDAESEKIQTLQTEIEKQKDRFANILANLLSVLVFGVPYLSVSVAIVLIQNQYGTLTVKGIALLTVTIIVAVLMGTLYRKTKQCIQKKIKAKL